MRQRLLLAAAFLSAACTSNGNDGGTTGNGPFKTSLSASAKLSDLSAAQRQELCNEFQSFATTTSWSSVIEGSCRWGGLLAAELTGPQDDAALQAACQTAYDDCKSAGEDPSTTTTEVDCTAPGGTWMCSATVGEVVACVNDTVTQIATFVASFPPCSDLTLAYLAGDAGISDWPGAPPSCQALNVKCPSATGRGPLVPLPRATR